MNRKLLLLTGLLLLALVLGACGPSQAPTATEAPAAKTNAPPTEQPAPTGPQEFEEMPIVTTASNVVGVGSYVAAEPYAIAAGEDPAEQPVQAFIFPYGITPNMHVTDIAEFNPPEVAVEGFSFEWSLKAPDGSAASLMGAPFAIWLADRPGDYVLSLTATDESGNSGTASWTVHAAMYVGVGGLVGDDPKPPQCAACHAGKVATWGETGHASMLTRGLDGTLSDHYNANCLECHTTGFNNRPEAANGGFDDLAATSSWLFPEKLEEGNWAAMVEDFPNLAALGQIQCESCHGPGSDHYTADVSAVGPINRGLSYGTCAQCHAEEPYHVFPQQWELSAHADKNARAFWYPTGEEHTACVRCHSGAGYIDSVNGESEPRTGYQVITCAVCHDPHGGGNPHQLRTFDLVTLPDGTQVENAGPAATCMSCHNSRQDATQVEGGEALHLPHYSTAAELLNNTGGYTWNEPIENSPHGTIVEETCIGCHMAATPGMDDNGTPDDSSDDTPLPGHNSVGEHTFSMVSPVDGAENVAVCQTCHENVESFEFAAKSDYDGDGEVESNQAEIEGLRARLYDAMLAKGVVDLGHYPYFQLPANADTDLRGAVWNYQFTGSGGSAVHNFKHTLGLLQLSLEKLGG